MFNTPEGARCGIESAILCDYRTVYDMEDAVIDVCRNCGKRQVYRKKGGRIDSRQYADDHLRDFLQPYGAMLPLYRKIYGMESLKVARDHKAMKDNKTRRIQEMRDYAQETYKTAKRLESKAKL